MRQERATFPGSHCLFSEIKDLVTRNSDFRNETRRKATRKALGAEPFFHSFPSCLTIEVYLTWIWKDWEVTFKFPFVDGKKDCMNAELTCFCKGKRINLLINETITVARAQCWKVRISYAEVLRHDLSITRKPCRLNSWPHLFLMYSAQMFEAFAPGAIAWAWYRWYFFCGPITIPVVA